MNVVKLFTVEDIFLFIRRMYMKINYYSRS